MIDSSTKQQIGVNQALQLMAGEQQETADYFRAGIEISMVLAVGAVGYVLDHSNQVDWQYGISDSIQSKVLGTKGYAFDDNVGYRTNWGHAYAGAGYYLTCRSNGLNQLEAFICTLAASR